MSPRKALLLSLVTFAASAGIYGTLAWRYPDSPEQLLAHRSYSRYWLELGRIHRSRQASHAYHRPAWERSRPATHVRGWDQRSFLFLNSGIHNRAFCVTMPWITLLGTAHWATAMILTSAAAFRKTRDERWRLTARLSLGAVAVGAITPLLKLVVPRSRPPAIFVEEATLLVHPLFGGSFPSGHAFTAFALGVLVALRHRWTTPWALGMATLVAFSRIAVGVHFPVDVVGGVVLGSITGYLFHRWGRSLESRKAEVRSAEVRTAVPA